MCKRNASYYATWNGALARSLFCNRKWDFLILSKYSASLPSETYFLTFASQRFRYWMNPMKHDMLILWSRALFDKLTITQPVKEIPSFYRIRRFITVLTTVRHWSPTWARWIQSTHSHPVSLRYILILPFHLHLGLPSGLFPSGFPTKIFVRISHPSHACCTPRPFHFLHLITLITFGKAYNLW